MLKKTFKRFYVENNLDLLLYFIKSHSRFSSWSDWKTLREKKHFLGHDHVNFTALYNLLAKAILFKDNGSLSKFSRVLNIWYVMNCRKKIFTDKSLPLLDDKAILTPNTSLVKLLSLKDSEFFIESDRGIPAFNFYSYFVLQGVKLEKTLNKADAQNSFICYNESLHSYVDFSDLYKSKLLLSQAMQDLKSSQLSKKYIMLVDTSEHRNNLISQFISIHTKQGYGDLLNPEGYFSLMFTENIKNKKNFQKLTMKTLDNRELSLFEKSMLKCIVYSLITCLVYLMKLIGIFFSYV